MKNEQSADVVIRFSMPFRIAILLITLTAVLVFIPPAVQAIPMEIFGLIFILVLIPGVLAYASFFVLTYQIQIKSNTIAAEAIPNPVMRSFQCKFADMSGIEKDSVWSNVIIYRFREAEPYRIMNMEFLDAGPILLLDEIKARLPGDIFIARITDSLRRWWKWHRLLANSILLLGAVWFSIRLLSAGGMLAFTRIQWDPILTILLVALLIMGIPDLLIIRLINRDA